MSPLEVKGTHRFYMDPSKSTTSSGSGANPKKSSSFESAGGRKTCLWLFIISMMYATIYSHIDCTKKSGLLFQVQF